MRGGKKEEVKRRKVVITSIVIGSALFAGTAFAAFNAGELLNSWYQANMKVAAGIINTKVVLPAETKIYNQFNRLVSRLIENSKTPIDDQTTKARFNSSLSILNYGNKYENEIKNTKREILGTKQKSGIMDQDFEGFVQEESQTADNAINETIGQVVRDLTDELDGVVNESKAAMQESSSNTQKELANVIAASKQQITDKLNSEKADSLETIKNEVNSDVTAAKVNIQGDTKTYVDADIQKVQDTGSGLKDNAEKELANVISNINK